MAKTLGLLGRKLGMTRIFAPDGTIVSAKVTKSSGNKAWDDAVLRALDKTATIPRDVDGTVPNSFNFEFRPQDR